MLNRKEETFTKIKIRLNVNFTNCSVLSAVLGFSHAIFVTSKVTAPAAARAREIYCARIRNLCYNYDVIGFACEFTEPTAFERHKTCFV